MRDTILIPLRFLISDPFDPHINDVYSYLHHSIPSLITDKNKSHFGIKAQIIIYEVTEEMVNFHEDGKRLGIPRKEFAAYVCSRGLIPQYTLVVFNEYVSGRLTD